SCPSCGLWSGGGGVSTFLSKPTWQFGVPGIPSDGARDQPDVSLTSAIHDPYLLCFEGSCDPSQGYLVGIGGTSAAAPSFAGIMALVVQQHGRQGQANYVLYRLAASQAQMLPQCNGSSTTTLPASACIFNDVTKGNNAVPGEVGFGTSTAKYQARAGYDLATGLGSVNVANLVNQWNSVAFNATTTALSPGSISGTHGSPVTLNVSVAGNGGSGTPTGDVALKTSNNQGVGFLTLSNGSASSALNNLPGGSYTLTAQYGGDANFAPSPPSNAVTVNITPENSVTTMSIFSFNQFGSLVPYGTQPYGSPAYLRTDVTAQSGHGTPTGSVFLTENGSSFLGLSYNLDAQGTGTIARGFFLTPVGQHSVVANYSGDVSFNASSSSPVTMAVTPAPTTLTVTSSSNTIAANGTVTLVANITTNSGGTRPSGSITFLSGGVPISNPANPASVGGNDGGGNIQSGTFQAAYGGASLMAALPTGQNTITAQYSGDSNYLSSSAPAIIVTVAADFTFSAGTPAVSVHPGGSGTDTLTITGQTGYNGTINFSSASCAGLPPLSKCSFNPASVTGSGSTTVTITTTAPSFASLRRFGWTSAGFVFAGVLLLGVPHRRLRSAAVLSVLLFVMVAGNIGCGGGSGGGGGGGNPGTPRGSFPVTVTAATTDGVITHTVVFTLTVQ
ncbi:MAG TPA: Ig-like domain repeat protein, partial [Terriglobales bacterium]|nr:Ig-like domain repeat protein [Terriglobales bacterium]